MGRGSSAARVAGVAVAAPLFDADLALGGFAVALVLLVVALVVDRARS